MRRPPQAATSRCRTARPCPPERWAAGERWQFRGLTFKGTLSLPYGMPRHSASAFRLASQGVPQKRRLPLASSCLRRLGGEHYSSLYSLRDQSSEHFFTRFAAQVGSADMELCSKPRKGSALDPQAFLRKKLGKNLFVFCSLLGLSFLFYSIFFLSYIHKNTALYMCGAILTFHGYSSNSHGRIPLYTVSVLVLYAYGTPR